jgi:ubiquinone/menaquinone biosynthesis C-methylase UbiE
MTKQAEREFANKVDQGYLYQKPFNDPRVFREFSVVLELFGSRIPGGSVLDVGCGSGWTSLFLARSGYRVTGVDLSERMIEVAQDKARQENLAVDFAVADMEELDLARKDFDAALYFDCLHHCPGYQQALNRVCDHLRPGGYILLLETTLLHRYSPHAREFSRQYGVTELGFTRGQLRGALRTAGFGNITFYHDPGECYRGFLGFGKAALRLLAGFVFYYPQAKNIVIAQKPAGA